MQPLLDNDRDFVLTNSGDLQTTLEDRIQNTIGNVVVQLRDDMFDDSFGIDYEFIAKLGNQYDAIAYVEAVVREKFNIERLEVKSLKVLSLSYPLYTIEVEYVNELGEELINQFTFNII